MSTNRPSIGNAQNAAVRAVLWKGMEKPPSASQLRIAEAEAITHFYGLCAYGGKPCGEHPHFDHAVPSNRDYLGENCIGNRVPSCERCNDEKGGSQDFREFLSGKPNGQQQIEKILAWMELHDYSPPPLGDAPQGREIMERVRARVAAAILEGSRFASAAP